MSGFVKPHETALTLGLLEGMKVADLGAGAGHYAFAVAGAVGPLGRVYAVDVQPDVVGHLRASARSRRVSNLEAIWGDIEQLGGSMLRDSSVDAAIISNVLFESGRPEAIVAEAKRILKPSGKLLVIDWAGAYSGMGPVAHLVMPEHAAEAHFIDAGFHKVRSLRPGPHHYGILFTAPQL